MPVYLLLSAAQVMVRACDHRFQQFTYRQAILRGLAVALAQHLVSRRIAFVQPRIQAFQGRAHRRAIYAKRLPCFGAQLPQGTRLAVADRNIHGFLQIIDTIGQVFVAAKGAQLSRNALMHQVTVQPRAACCCLIHRIK